MVRSGIVNFKKW